MPRQINEAANFKVQIKRIAEMSERLAAAKYTNRGQRDSLKCEQLYPEI
jgi:hypothetical protein